MAKLTKREQFEALAEELRGDESAAIADLKEYLDSPAIADLQKTFSGFMERAVPGGQFEAILRNHSIVLGAVYQYVTSILAAQVQTDAPDLIPAPPNTET